MENDNNSSVELIALAKQIFYRMSILIRNSDFTIYFKITRIVEVYYGSNLKSHSTIPVIFETHSTMPVISINYSTMGVISRNLNLLYGAKFCVTGAYISCSGFINLNNRHLYIKAPSLLPFSL